MSPQTADHMLWECEPLRKQRQCLRNSIRKVGGNWPITNSDLAVRYTKFFQMFVNNNSFEDLEIVNINNIYFPFLFFILLETVKLRYEYLANRNLHIFKL
jgi:hypothetical protein